MIAQLKQKLSSSDIAKRLAVGAGWQVTSTVCSKAIIMVAGIICARFLGKEIYGEFGMIRSTVALLMSIGGSGLGLTATKYLSQYRASDAAKSLKVYYVTNSFAVAVALLLAVLVYVFSQKISVDLLHCSGLIASMRFASVIIFVVVINAAQDGVIAGFEAFRSRARNNVLGNFVQGVCMVIGAYYFSLIGAVVGYAAGMVALVLLNKITIDSLLKRSGIVAHAKGSRLSLSDFKIIYTYSLPATVSTLLAAPTFWVIRTLLVRYTGGFGEVAIFDVADQWKTMILFVPAAVCQVVMPVLSSIDGNRTEFWKVLNVNIVINFSVALIMATAVSIFSPFILSLYGDDFTDFLPMIILAGSCAFTSVSTILGVSISSLGRMWTWCFFNVLWGAEAIVLSWLFLSCGMRASGVALGVLISYILHALLQYLYLRFSYKVK